MCVICRDTCANVVLRVPQVTAPRPPPLRLLFLHSDRRGPPVRGYPSSCWGGGQFKQRHPWWEGDQGWHLPSVLCSFLHHVQSRVAPVAGWGEGPSSSRMLLGGETSQVGMFWVLGRGWEVADGQALPTAFPERGGGQLPQRRREVQPLPPAS